MAKEEKELSFEESLKQLEEIVTRLENGDIALDDAIENFNKAMTLAKLCDQKLKDAEKSLSKIVKEDGTIEDFEVESK